jgi:hypothetical protein
MAWASACDADDLIARSRLPNYAATITFWNLGLAFGMVC